MSKNTHHTHFILQNTVGKIQEVRLQCARKWGFGYTVLQSKYNESLTHCSLVFREDSQQNLLSLNLNGSTTERCKHKRYLIKTKHFKDSGAQVHWHLLMSFKCSELFHSFVLCMNCIIHHSPMWSSSFICGLITLRQSTGSLVITGFQFCPVYGSIYHRPAGGNVWFYT